MPIKLSGKKDLWEHKRVSPADYSPAMDNIKNIKVHMMFMVGLWVLQSWMIILPDPNPVIWDYCSFPASLRLYSLSAAFVDISSTILAPSQAVIPRVQAYLACHHAGICLGLQESPGSAAQRGALPLPVFRLTAWRIQAYFPVWLQTVPRLLLHLSCKSAEHLQCRKKWRHKEWHWKENRQNSILFSTLTTCPLVY